MATSTAQEAGMVAVAAPRRSEVALRSVAREASAATSVLSPYLVVDGPRPRTAGRRRATNRRRLRTLVLLFGLVLAVRSMPGGPGGAPLSAPEPARASAPSPPPVHVVQPGDTLWSIARSLQPHGEVRPLVDRLASQRQGRPLRVGERIELPAHR